MGKKYTDSVKLIDKSKQYDTAEAERIAQERADMAPYIVGSI